MKKKVNTRETQRISGPKKSKRFFREIANKPVAKIAKKLSKKVKAKAKKQKPIVKVVVEKRILGHAPEKHQFVFSNGKKVRNIYQLIDELENMHEDVFKQHVNEHKNDFANWVEHVFEGKGLADELRQIEDRLDTQRAILKELVRQLSLEKKQNK